MVTTTSSTGTSASTPTLTPTPTKNSATNSAVQQLLTSLDAGSGIDTGSLVSSLVTAQFAAKSAQLTARSDTLTAQISGISTLKSTIANFATALDNLVKGGSLQPQPTSSNTGALKASVITGVNAANVSSSITIEKLATAQGAVAKTPVASRATVLGAGELTLTVGALDGSGNTIPSGKATTIKLTKADATIDDLAAAINASGAGVSASVITAADGKAYLSLKGTTGTDNAFTLESADSGSALDQFNVGNGAAGMNVVGAAGNAKLTVDGVAVERSSNTITDLVDGVKLDLVATTSAPVSLSQTTPTDNLSQAVTDFVDAYNEVIKIVQEQTDPFGGPLRADPAAQTLLRSLKAMTLTPLVTGAAAGTPTTLADIGVGTTRDGTLQVNTATLTTALQKAPQSIIAMFAYSSTGTTGLSASLKALSTEVSNNTYGLGASGTRYAEQQSDLAKDQDKLTDQTDQLTTRMTQQFSSMSSRVASYKSTQSFLDQQIKVWTKSS